MGEGQNQKYTNKLYKERKENKGGYPLFISLRLFRLWAETAHVHVIF